MPTTAEGHTPHNDGLMAEVNIAIIPSLRYTHKMSTYAIGDIQGCFNELQTLLTTIDFNPQQDRLWLTGDLINRGPHSLETLNFVKNLGPCAITVLGNHDLHFLAIAAGAAKASACDTLQPLLNDANVKDLVDWLRQQPFIYHDPHLGYTLSHAGIYPLWSLQEALNYGQEISEVLSSDRYVDFLKVMYGNEPKRWTPQLTGIDRLRFITNAFTRMRLCDRQGTLELTYNGSPDMGPKGFQPWYEILPKNFPSKILFGHWAALTIPIARDDVMCLDSGCVWGKCLMALRLEDGQCFFVDAE